jgi:hypothetical protein
VELAKGEPELDEDRHKLQDVDMLLAIVNGWFGIIVLIVPAHISRESSPFQLCSGKAPHVIQVVKRRPAAHSTQWSVGENMNGWRPWDEQANGTAPGRMV